MPRALTVCLLVTAAATAADADAERKALAGTWVIEDAVLAGRDHKDDFAGMTLTLDGDRFTIAFAENSDRGTFTLDPAKSPKWITITTSPKGPFKGRTLPGIYDLKGDRLVVCCNSETDDRPTAFEAKEKTPLMLLTYTREKPKR
jgi:uncharacterized protein (TIGR03067 family)